jgi:hypothetical protein
MRAWSKKEWEQEMMRSSIQASAWEVGYVTALNVAIRGAASLRILGEKNPYKSYGKAVHRKFKKKIKRGEFDN